jgi:hypothetical protein
MKVQEIEADNVDVSQIEMKVQTSREENSKKLKAMATLTYPEESISFVHFIFQGTTEDS